MKLFLKKIIIFITCINLPVVLILIIFPKNYHIGGAELILEYQLQKLKSQKKIKTAFFGDSSCGNAIDAQLYNNQTINLSLVGAYNLEGSLEMIKKANENFNSLDTAIIMHTIDVFHRENAKTYKVSDFSYSLIEIFNRNLRIFLKKLFKNDYKYLFKNKNRISLKYDYLEQEDYTDNYNIMDFSTIVDSVNSAIVDSISNDNKRSIDNIVKYCDDNGIKYLFLFAPNVELGKNRYLQSIISYFSFNKYNFSKNYYKINFKNIGDSNDHVSTLFKKDATKYYKDEIFNFFN